MKGYSKEVEINIATTLLNTYDIQEAYDITLYMVFNEKPGYKNLQFARGIDFGFIYQLYKDFCFGKTETKIIFYQFLKKLRDEKSFEIFENSETHKAIQTILKKFYLWKQSPSTWKKKSRNPHRQIESLINHLFCKYPIPKFMYSIWYSTTLYNQTKPVHIFEQWFMHLADGKSAKNLPGLNFTWTKKMAHDFINAPTNLEPKEAVIRAISKSAGGNERLYSSLYIPNIKDGLFSGKIVTSEFWASVIEYFSKQEMFDYAHISHVIDYINAIKYTGTPPEKPNFEIKKKNLQTLINETEEWQQVLHAMRGAVGGNRRGIVDYAAQLKSSLATKWSPLPNMPGWNFSRTIKLPGKSNKKIELIYSMKELCTGDELYNEGRAMGHCVYSYVNSCYNGKCRIFSLRESASKSCVLTVEVRGSEVVQVRGQGNRRASKDEINILKSWANKSGLTLKDPSLR